MALCGVGKILNSLECRDSNVRFLYELTVPPSAHLQKYSLANDILSEGQLIGARVGLFSEEQWKYLTVCQHHKSLLGLSWKPRQQKSCHYPTHTGKGKAERGVSLKTSMEIKQKFDILLQVGTGICQSCRKAHTEAMKHRLTHISDTTGVINRPPVLSAPQTIADSELTEACFEGTGTEPMQTFYQGTRDERFVCIEMPETAVGEYFDEKSIYNGETFSRLSQETVHSETTWNNSQPTSLSQDSGDVWQPSQLSSVSAITSNSSTSEDPVNAINYLFALGGKSPLKRQLQTNIEESSRTTQWYYKRKAEQAIESVLDIIAPEQALKLFKITHFNEKTDDTSSENMLSDLITIYDNADNSKTKCQILSIISEKASKRELMTLIPGLTKWRIDQARKHGKENGQGMPVEKKQIKRERLDPHQIDHFLNFISQPEYLQDISYGTKNLKLSSGRTLTIPNVVRTVIHSRLVHTYLKYCEELEYSPLSESSLFRILDVCGASKRKNLAGLDNFQALGVEAFVLLEKILKRTEEVGLPTEQIKKSTKEGKRYLKGDFKTHLQISENCGFHCIQFALSDPKEKEFSVQCSHVHSISCDRCKNIEDIFHVLENNIDCIPDPYTKEELQHDLERAKIDINNWKRHIIRSTNQNFAKQDIIRDLKNNQIIIFMDWAMKFIPIIDRESQSEWFGKKGLSWHVSAVVQKNVETEEELVINCYVHLFDFCTQNWFSVASILEHVLHTIKKKEPVITEAFLRSDNAGCYHCAPLFLSIPGISKRTGIQLSRYDFSDAQGGKDICDRRIAPIKQHIKAYAHEGNTLRTASDMKRAIESYGGIANTFASVVEVNMPCQTLHKWKWSGVSELSNILYFNDTITVWRQYNIGCGKTLSIEDQTQMTSGKKQDATNIKVIEDFKSTCKPKKIKPMRRAESTELISCSDSNCVSMFKTYAEMEEHLDTGYHNFQLQQESTFDQIARKWGNMCTDIPNQKVATVSQNQN